MSRLLKFRLWTKSGEMIYNVVPFQWDYCINTMWHKCIKSNGAGILGCNSSEAEFEVGGFSIIDGALMQFTGLHDKNGKEIFEGDIFRVEEQAEDRIYYLVIHWIKEWCMFGCLTVGEYTDYLTTGISALDEPMFWTYTLEDTDSQKFFLCGNIYQNKNLIEL